MSMKSCLPEARVVTFESDMVVRSRKRRSDGRNETEADPSSRWPRPMQVAIRCGKSGRHIPA